jgi:peptidoglycan/xylan/chitin deacetylase (PgdA/CDA1 family)
LSPGRLPAFVRASAALHVLGPASLLVRPSLWPFVVSGLVADHLLLVAGGLVPRSRLLGPNVVRLDVSEPVVALTFDDGPDPELTPRVLETLERRGARASFFCIGERAERHPGLVREIARAGHAVENHTWRHPLHFFFLAPGALGREIDRAQRVLADAAGRAPAYVRAPAGIRSPLLQPALARRGLALVSWTRRGFDTVSADAARVAARLLRGSAAGDILLLHDGGTRRDAAGGPSVIRALDLVLDGLAERGLSAVALPRPHDRAR